MASVEMDWESLLQASREIVAEYNEGEGNAFNAFKRRLRDRGLTVPAEQASRLYREARASAPQPSSSQADAEGQVAAAALVPVPLSPTGAGRSLAVALLSLRDAPVEEEAAEDGEAGRALVDLAELRTSFLTPMAAEETIE